VCLQGLLISRRPQKVASDALQKERNTVKQAVRALLARWAASSTDGIEDAVPWKGSVGVKAGKEISPAAVWRAVGDLV
jgi:hypothetical protein